MRYVVVGVRREHVPQLLLELAHGAAGQALLAFAVQAVHRMGRVLQVGAEKSMVKGQRSMVNGQWSMVNGQALLVFAVQAVHKVGRVLQVGVERSGL